MCGLLGEGKGGVGVIKQICSYLGSISVSSVAKQFSSYGNGNTSMGK